MESRSDHVDEVRSLRVGQTSAHRVRDVRQGPDGLLYVLIEAPKGRIVRLEPAAAGG